MGKTYTMHAKFRPENIEGSDDLGNTEITM
jgi:hypothetical protein